MDNAVIFTIFILLLITVLVIFARINSLQVPKKRREKIFKSLNNLEVQIQSEDMYARRDAIIRLDNLLSKSLQTRYKNENSCGENLKLAKSLFKKDIYQKIWDVHKTRNDIVHKDEDISYDSAQQAYKIYKMAIIKILG